MKEIRLRLCELTGTVVEMPVRVAAANWLKGYVDFARDDMEFRECSE